MESTKIMFTEPLLDILSWLKGLVPTSFMPGKTHFNFITIHYIYLVTLTLVGSVILYPSKLMSYIDALFFAAGSATQSGLNTIDVNLLETYQQVTLLLIASIANPIFINTAVSFVRLYWFEKRFQGIVKEARKSRRAKTISRSRSDMRDDATAPDVEQGLRGRKIRVLHHTTKPNGMNAHTIHAHTNGISDSNVVNPGNNLPGTPVEIGATDFAVDSSTPPEEHFLGRNPLLRRDIMFADEQPNAKTEANELNEKVSDTTGQGHHIAFLERQRKQDQGTLRIPGPRDFDRGDVPREVDSDDEELDHAVTRDTGPGLVPARRRDSNDTAAERTADEANAPRKGIVFDVPDRSEKQQQKSESSSESHHHGPRFNPLRPFSAMHRSRRLSSTTISRVMHRIKDSPRTMSMSRSQERDMGSVMPYLSWQATIGRNSQFIDLSEEQREELGGIEYRSLKTLCIILVCYYVGFHLLGMIIFLPWILKSKTYGPVVDAAGQSRAWWGIFTPASLFNDLGLTLTADSMESFQGAVLPLLLGSFLIVIGNTGFPCMLRFIIWLLNKFVRRGSALWEELRFLLDHPRRCFTLLFPSKATWWLFWLLVLLNAVDLLFFIILDLNDSTVTTLPQAIRVLVGWFQATSTRTAGFAAINLAALHPAIQVSYLIMMYISVFPIAISVRRTNVYEEKSLGIWGGSGDEDENETEDKSYVGTHLRRQLSFDLWYIFLGLFIISIIEGRHIENTNEYAFTMFSILFEIVSAYGTVGLSLGYPGINASFSTEFAVLSKLIIIAMMLRGRHRGLPYALDRAILLPSENRFKKETEEAARRALRRNSMSSSKAPMEDRNTTALESRPTINTMHSAQGDLPGLQHTSTTPSMLRKTHSRRPSELSQNGTPAGRQRTRTITSLIVSGLTTGPSTPQSFHRKDN